MSTKPQQPVFDESAPQPPLQAEDLEPFHHGSIYIAGGEPEIEEEEVVSTD